MPRSRCCPSRAASTTWRASARVWIWCRCGSRTIGCVVPEGQLLPVPLLCSFNLARPSVLPSARRNSLPRPARRVSSTCTSTRHRATAAVAVRRYRRVLVFATLVGQALHDASRRAHSAKPVISNLNARITAWWVMVGLMGAAFVLGKIEVIRPLRVGIVLRAARVHHADPDPARRSRRAAGVVLHRAVPRGICWWRAGSTASSPSSFRSTRSC